MGDKRRKSKSLRVPHLPLVSERNPAEVWLHIIEDSNLTDEDITNLSFVSRFVRWISQPILFRKISASIFSQPSGPPGTTTFYLERLRARLAFATSQRIAHGVNSVAIRCSSGTSSFAADYVVDASLLVEAVFSALPNFQNLSSFSISDSKLSGRHFDILAQLPRLSGLHFYRCSGSGDLGLSRFRLTELSLHGTIGGSFGWWISLMNPSTIQSLSYSTLDGTLSPIERFLSPPNPDSEDSVNLFFPALSIGPRMTNLAVLRLPSHAPQSRCYVTALQRCPNVQCLIVEPGSRFSQVVPVYLPPSTMPRLKAVSAVLAFVEGSFLIGSKRQLKQLRIEDAMRSSAAVLSLTRQFPSVQELVITVDMGSSSDVYIELVREICNQLSGLQGLCVHIEGYYSMAGSERIWDLLRNPNVFPQSLRSLRILCDNNNNRLSRAVLGMHSIKLSSSRTQGSKPKRFNSHRMELEVVSGLRRHCPGLVDICIEVSDERGLVWHEPYTKMVKWWDWDEQWPIGRCLN
ncbi:hypothetical protein BDY19DRAFT_975546 [Irpex rosettiformis]|uniref:Uncharacterized protein n=1 Tax=Irpex rosettiformis TaxID=378272 RepID=A0ACB8TPZ5_9APHY|nr:hypothetical protein BDY19DRAFT_975546 [Irpex rosettiformis]